MHVKLPIDRTREAADPYDIVTGRSQRIPSHALTQAVAQQRAEPPSARKDHFIARDGEEFAGLHLILDLWGAKRLDDLEYVDCAMREAVEVAGATLLHIHLHHFGEEGGVSGVAVLAESHISVHTWPERGFAAFDVFMCGDAEPQNAIASLRGAFDPACSELVEVRRGRV